MWRGAVRVGAVVLLVAGGFWLATFGAFEQEVRQSVEGGYPLPAFRLAVLNDGLFSEDTTFIDSEDLRGRVALVTFWATWCGPCDAEQPSFLALQDEFGEDGLVLLGVLHEDRPRAALEWLKQKGRLKLKTVVGVPEFARAARVGGLPHTALVDREGMITELFLGYWPEREPYIRKAIQALLSEGEALP